MSLALDKTRVPTPLRLCMDAGIHTHEHSRELKSAFLSILPNKFQLLSRFCWETHSRTATLEGTFLPAELTSESNIGTKKLGKNQEDAAATQSLVGTSVLLGERCCTRANLCCFSPSVPGGNSPHSSYGSGCSHSTLQGIF